MKQHQQQKSKTPERTDADKGLPVEGGVVNRTGDWDRAASDRNAKPEQQPEGAPAKR